MSIENSKSFYGRIRSIPTSSYPWKSGMWRFEFDDLEGIWTFSLFEIQNHQNCRKSSTNTNKSNGFFDATTHRKIFACPFSSSLKSWPTRRPQGKSICIEMKFDDKCASLMLEPNSENVTEIYEFISQILQTETSFNKLSSKVMPSSQETSLYFTTKNTQNIKQHKAEDVRRLVTQDEESPVKKEPKIPQDDNRILTGVRNVIPSSRRSNRTPTKRSTSTLNGDQIVAVDKENKNRATPNSHLPSTSTRTPLLDRRSSSSTEAELGGLSTSQFYGSAENSQPKLANVYLPPLANYSREEGENANGVASKRSLASLDVVKNSPKRKKLNTVTDACWQASSSTTPSKVPLLGFSNLGNTCYMNSILQALFALDCFTKELWKAYSHFKCQLSQDLLFSCLPALMKVKDSDIKETKDELLLQVKNVISTSATRFSGFSQHDAHEFLEQVLDQLKEEVKLLIDQDSTSSIANPIESNLEFSVSHCILCQRCENSVRKDENFNDLSLDLPTSSFEDRPISLQTLIDKFFQSEQVEYKCEECKQSDLSLMRHRFTKLPRILILHIKRYSFDSTSATNFKSAQTISIPTFLTLHRHCADDSVPPSNLSASTKKIRISSSLDDATTTNNGSSSDCCVATTNGCATRTNGAVDVEFVKTSPSYVEQLLDDDLPTLDGVMNNSSWNSTPSSKAKRRLYLDNNNRTLTNQRYSFRALAKKNYADDEIAPTTTEDVRTSSLEAESKEDDEDADLKKALELSMLDTSSSAACSMSNGGEAVGAATDEEEYEKQLQQALEISRLEARANAAEDSLDYSFLDEKINCASVVVEHRQNSVDESEMASNNNDASIFVLDPELQEHADKGHLPEAFRLCGIVSHLGLSSSTGHYVCDVYDLKTKRWKSCDDSRISSIEQEDVQRERQKTGYIFFYVAKKLLEENE